MSTFRKPGFLKLLKGLFGQAADLPTAIPAAADHLVGIDATTGQAAKMLLSAVATFGSNSGAGLSVATPAAADHVVGIDATTGAAAKMLLSAVGSFVTSFEHVATIGTPAAAANKLLAGIGTTAAPATTATAGKVFVELRCKTTATSGDNRLGYFRYQIDGAGASGECLRAFTDLTKAAATARGAHISLQAGATGYVTGLGVGVDAQLYVKDEAVAANGTYYAGQSDVYFEGASGSLAAVTKHAIHHFQTSGNATGQATCKNVWAIDAPVGNEDNSNAISPICLAELPVGTIGIATLINGKRYFVPAVLDSAWNAAFE